MHSATLRLRVCRVVVPRIEDVESRMAETGIENRSRVPGRSTRILSEFHSKQYNLILSGYSDFDLKRIATLKKEEKEK